MDEKGLTEMLIYYNLPILMVIVKGSFLARGEGMTSENSPWDFRVRGKIASSLKLLAMTISLICLY